MPDPSTHQAEARGGELRAILGNSRPCSQTTSQKQRQSRGPVVKVRSRVCVPSILDCQASPVSPSSRKKPFLGRYKRQLLSCPHSHAPSAWASHQEKGKQSHNPESSQRGVGGHGWHCTLFGDKCWSGLCITPITYAWLGQHL